MSTSEMYAPTCLTIDTSFNWTASSSPLSSIPGTPQMFSAAQTPCDPTSTYPPPSDVYDPSAEYLPQHQHGTQLYPTGLPTFCMPTDMDMGFGTQDFGDVHPKGDFSTFYGRQTLETVDAALAPPYLASLSAFAY